jgi:hypothetical protein
MPKINKSPGQQHAPPPFDVDIFSNLMRTLILLAWIVSALAPLEQPNGAGIHFGAWYDRLNGDTPVKMIERVGSKPFSFFQSDMNITETMDDEQMGYINQFVEQVEATESDAFIYLTLYPFFGFERVTDLAIDQFAQRVKKIVDSGRKILIRYASEMNGSWFAYGQQPTAFKGAWIKMVTHVREVTKYHRDSVAFLWAPNSGVGYPFLGNSFSAIKNSTRFDSDLDTNQDGQFDDNDDPFSPYYPGDEWVDWVGFSVISNLFSYIIMEINGPIVKPSMVMDGTQTMFQLFQKQKTISQGRMILLSVTKMALETSLTFTKCFAEVVLEECIEEKWFLFRQEDIHSLSLKLLQQYILLFLKVRLS